MMCECLRKANQKKKENMQLQKHVEEKTMRTRKTAVDMPYHHVYVCLFHYWSLYFGHRGGGDHSE